MHRLINKSRFTANFTDHLLPVQCRTFTGPFHGTVEGVNSTWKATGAILAHQNSLPCQPVPPLNQTMCRFLDSVRPLLEDEKYADALKLTRDFSKEGGEGAILQKLLEKRADEKENWLADWWIKVAYLGVRSCLMWNSAVIMAPPLEQFKGKEGQLRCAAIAIRSVMDLKEHLDSQDLPIEKIGTNPQCMMQYFHALGCCRIPGPDMDIIKCYHDDPTASKHVTVLSNNHIFHVDVYDDRGHPLNIQQIQSQLEVVMTQSQSIAPAIGLLTDDDRDSWYKIYSELRKDPENVTKFDSIHKSLLAVSLNKPIPGYSRETHFDVTSISNVSGGGTSVNSGNRWTDKALRYYVHEDGIFGYSFDHSLVDGPPVGDIVKNTIKYLNKPIHDQPCARSDIPTPRKLEFNLTPEVESRILTVGDYINRNIHAITAATFLFDKYGFDQVKKFNIPPDGFVQANIQLAHYRLHGHLVSSHQSSSLRKFRLGRTETIRCASVSVLEWCQAMNRSDVSVQERVHLLREAAKHHQWYSQQSVQGQAVDMHLFGLNMMAQESNIDVPHFLADPIYNDSKHFILSATNVPLIGGGVFPPCVNDGYSVYYDPKKDPIIFTLSTWTQCQKTKLDEFKQALDGALIDSYNMCLDTA